MHSTCLSSPPSFVILAMISTDGGEENSGSTYHLYVGDTTGVVHELRERENAATPED